MAFGELFLLDLRRRPKGDEVLLSASGCCQKDVAPERHQRMRLLGWEWSWLC